LSTRAKSCVSAAYPHYQENAPAVERSADPETWRTSGHVLFSHQRWLGSLTQKPAYVNAPIRGRRGTTPRHVTGPNRLPPDADNVGARGCCVSSRAKSALAGIWGHATLQTPMGIYHANPQGFQTQVSL